MKKLAYLCIASLVSLSAGAFAEPNPCKCENCTCTPESHCGCFSNEGCHCEKGCKNCDKACKNCDGK